MDIWVTIGSILLSLTVTFLFNYFVGLPKKLKQEKQNQQNTINSIIARCDSQDCRINQIQEVIDKMPAYRQQSLDIQASLRASDKEIVDLCREIASDVIQNRNDVMDKLIRLENREKNALRAKILEEHRLYTDESRNPMRAWSEMEEHSFRELVKDYEALGGNDYIHNTVLPEINHLNVISMHDLEGLKKLYDSRKVR